MNEGEVYRKLSEIPEVSMIEDGYEITAAAKMILDEMWIDFPNVELDMLSPQLDYDECKELIDKLFIWRKKWCGEKI